MELYNDKNVPKGNSNYRAVCTENILNTNNVLYQITP